MKKKDSISNIFIFTDLDDTLIQTKRKINPKKTISEGAYDRDGNPLSYFTESQKAILNLFDNPSSTFIPVTGRNTDALNRVNINFRSYRVVSHGAVVLTPDSHLCSVWKKSIEDKVEACVENLYIENSKIESTIKNKNLKARTRVIVDNKIPSYISIKGEIEDLNVIKRHHYEYCNFDIHENGRNHALLPEYAKKSNAVRFVMEQLGVTCNDLTIGIGDSLTDLDFMYECQYMMMPNNSQICRSKLHE